MTKKSLKPVLLEAGLKHVLHHGYCASSVRDITAFAEVPLGCFSNHFSSKEAFAEEILALYFSRMREYIRQTLEDESLSPLEKLNAYIDLITKKLEVDDFKRGCLIGDMSLELSIINERICSILLSIYSEWEKPFIAVITQAQKEGTATLAFSAQDITVFFLSAWEGAIMRMKVERNGKPLLLFKRIVFSTLFNNPSHQEK